MPEFRTIDAGDANIRVAVEGEGPLVAEGSLYTVAAFSALVLITEG